MKPPRQPLALETMTTTALALVRAQESVAVHNANRDHAQESLRDAEARLQQALTSREVAEIEFDQAAHDYAKSTRAALPVDKDAILAMARAAIRDEQSRQE